MTQPKPKIPILNPRAVPSVNYSQIHTQPVWTSKHLKLLTRQYISHALQKAHAVENLWAHDVSAHDRLREAAVLVLLIEQESGWDVVLTTRAQHLRHHPGQVSFVGGAVETGEIFEQTALREAREEINLDSSSVEILGQLPEYQTVTGFSVVPIVAAISEHAWQAQHIKIDANEVDAIFRVPLQNLFDDAFIEHHRFEYESHQRSFLSLTHVSLEQEYFIWGASMAMLHNLNLVLRSQWPK